jgi:hypothetical protein
MNHLMLSVETCAKLGAWRVASLASELSGNSDNGASKASKKRSNPKTETVGRMGEFQSMNG